MELNSPFTYEAEREISESDSSRDSQEQKRMSGALSTLTTKQFSLVFTEYTPFVDFETGDVIYCRKQ